MSALAMILAAMVVPGDGPEKVSGEMVRSRELEVSGHWKGIGWADGDVWQAEVSDRRLVMKAIFGEAASPASKATGSDRWEDGEILVRGAEKVTIRRNLTDWFYEGIYKWDDERLIICFGRAELGCPDSFQVGKQQWLLILHRVKSSK